MLQERDATHTVGGLIEPGLPNIIGEFSVRRPSGNIFGWITPTGAFFEKDSRGMMGQNGYGWQWVNIEFNAARYNTIYGKSSTVQPPAYAVRYLIRALP